MQENSWLIVGLGNPGPEYAKTRHNIGFRCIDILAGKLGVKIDRANFEGLYGQTEYKGNKLYLLKPLTYMNLSGRSVLQLSSFFKIPPQRIIVIFDNISLEPGRLRVRGNGSAGGHNGIKFSASEEKALAVSLENGANAALTLMTDGVSEAANQFNGSHP